MADSPAKRRKTSPTTSIPIDAPATPSRIPVRKDGSKTTPRRPSFASPTKASLSRHNPQLLNRPTSSGSGIERPSSRGKLDDMFAKALGERPSSRDGPSIITGEDRMGGPVDGGSGNTGGNSRPGTPKSRGSKALGGAWSANPRRMSRSPAKRVEKPAVGFSSRDIEQEILAGANPFQKKGLRRSPPPGMTAAETEKEMTADPVVEDTFNPFQKRGLRRSPVSSQPASQPMKPVDQQYQNATRLPEVSTTPQGPVPPHTGFVEISKEIARQEAAGHKPTPDQQQVRSAVAEAMSLNMANRSPSPVIAKPHSQRRPPGVAEIMSSHRTLRSSSPAVASPSTHRKALEVPEIVPTRRVLRSSSPAVAPSTQKRVPVVPAVISTRRSLRLSSSPIPDPLEQRKVPEAPEIISANRPPPFEEPELPPTPTQLGLADPIVTSPATGIHDTPTKRVKRKVGQKLKSSPLKPRDPPPPEVVQEKQPVRETVLDYQYQPAKPAKRRKSARFLIPEDPHAEKKKERDALLRELQQLQADVALANQENERLRLLSESKKKVPTVSNSDELLAMLQRATETSTAPKPKPASIFKSISSFLPFAPRRKPAPLLVSQKPLPSHDAIPLDNPLPYLQAFTPLTYTSTVTLHQNPPNSSAYTSDDTNSPLFQKHIITASHPSGLFTSRLSMLVNTTSLKITDLSVLRLDMNAETELGTFIRARAKSQGPLGKDVSVICWAMGRWIEVSIKRAVFWYTVDSELGNAAKRKQYLQRKKKRKRLGSVVDGQDDQEENEKSNLSRRQLLPYIGCTNMELVNEEVELRFEWKVAFDWTGEVESELGAVARLPKSCE